MNGKAWTEQDTATLRHMRARSNAVIAKATGHSEATVKKRRQWLGLDSYRGRENWTRRDWLLADAAGLDIQISF